MNRRVLNFVAVTLATTDTVAVLALLGVQLMSAGMISDSGKSGCV
jgi:hypothetical protein